MRKELEEKLASDYPDFFIGRSKPITESRMAEGCACDDGWYEIINDFCFLTKNALACARYVNATDGELVAHEGPIFEFVQIKEKMGSLRLYYKLWQPEVSEEGKDSSDIQLRLVELEGRIRGYSSYAFLLSKKTCEKTGLPGKLLHRGGLLKTLCSSEADRLGFEDHIPSGWSLFF